MGKNWAESGEWTWKKRASAQLCLLLWNISRNTEITTKSYLFICRRYHLCCLVQNQMGLLSGFSHKEKGWTLEDMRLLYCLTFESTDLLFCRILGKKAASALTPEEMGLLYFLTPGEFAGPLMYFLTPQRWTNPRVLPLLFASPQGQWWGRQKEWWADLVCKSRDNMLFVKLRFGNVFEEKKQVSKKEKLWKKKI